MSLKSNAIKQDKPQVKYLSDKLLSSFFKQKIFHPLELCLTNHWPVLFGHMLLQSTERHCTFCWITFQRYFSQNLKLG